MAECKQTSFDYVSGIFTPVIAILSNYDAEQIALKNNLTIVELLKPFARLSSETRILDPSNNHMVPVKGLQLQLVDVNDQTPVSATTKRTQLNDAVSTNIVQGTGSVRCVNKVNSNLSVSLSTPWFDSYRDTFFNVLTVSDHEYLRHAISCIFVVSGASQDPIASMNQLIHRHTELLYKADQGSNSIKWLSTNVYKHYVVLHDVCDGDIKRAEDVRNKLSVKHGIHSCYLLQINTRPLHQSEDCDSPGKPDPWSRFVSRKHVMTPNGDVNTSMVPISSDCSNQILKPEPMNSLDDAQLTAADVTNDNHPLAEKNAQPVPPDNSIDSTQVYQPSTFPHGICLTASDLDRIRILINEFIVRGLLPFLEQEIKSLHDNVFAKKGLRGSFFNTTKKWFGGSKQISSSANHGASIYSSDSVEMQLRRLADMCFLVQCYDLAYSVYYTLKREFVNDNAWLYLAGTLEMCALCCFMQDGRPRPYPVNYMETAISNYLNNCKNVDLAVRATFLGTECLKHQNLFIEAATELIKMTSEESDLRSALLLEQAALCYVRCTPPRIRKYTFHMILAGHRYLKSSQKHHALRTYLLAMCVLRGSGWKFAEDHINYMVGKQSSSLKLLPESCEAFRDLFLQDSRQSTTQQRSYLKEYLFVLRMMATDNTSVSLPILPLPFINHQLTRTLLGPYYRSTGDGSSIKATSVTFDHLSKPVAGDSWSELESGILESVWGKRFANGRPSIQCFSSATNNVTHPQSVIGESISVEVHLTNPLKVALVLQRASLIWKFTTLEGSQLVSSVPHADSNVDTCEIPVVTPVLEEILLSGMETRALRLNLIPMQMGNLVITGLTYHLSLTQGYNSDDKCSVTGQQPLIAKGRRLNQTLIHRTSVCHGADYRLDIDVLPKMPLLDAVFHGFPSLLLDGELRLASLELFNYGGEPLTNLHMSSTNPQLFLLSEDSGCSLFEFEKSSFSRHLVHPVYSSSVVKVPIEDIAPNESRTVALWVIGGPQAGISITDFLFYYEGGAVERHCLNDTIAHRILKHRAAISVSPSLCANARIVSFIGDKAIVSLEVTNACRDQSLVDLTVAQLTCVSSDWQLDVPVTPGAESPLSSGESMSCTVILTKMKEHSTAPWMSNATVSSTQLIQTADCPCNNFYHLYKKFNDTSASASSRTSGDDAIRPSVCTDIIVLWHAYVTREQKKEDTYGQTIVTVESNLKDDELQANSFRHPAGSNRACNVTKDTCRILTSHPPSVCHDFTSGALIQAIQVTVYNCSNVAQCLVVTAIDCVADQSEDSLCPYSWTGSTSRRLTLGALAQATLTFHALLSRPGTYNMAYISLATVNDISKEVKQTSRLSLLSVQSVDGLEVLSPL